MQRKTLVLQMLLEGLRLKGHDVHYLLKATSPKNSKANTKVVDNC